MPEIEFCLLYTTVSYQNRINLLNHSIKRRRSQIHLIFIISQQTNHAKVCIHLAHPVFNFSVMSRSWSNIVLGVCTTTAVPNTPYYIFSLQIKENENSEYHSI